jgi:hypothetical protein
VRRHAGPVVSDRVEARDDVLEAGGTAGLGQPLAQIGIILLPNRPP